MTAKDKTQSAQPAAPASEDETAQPASATDDGNQDTPPERVRWEVVGTPPWPVDATGPEEAAWTALQEWDAIENGKGYEPDPDPKLWVRRAGTDDEWQPVDVG